MKHDDEPLRIAAFGDPAAVRSTDLAGGGRGWDEAASLA